MTKKKKMEKQKKNEENNKEKTRKCPNELRNEKYNVVAIKPCALSIQSSLFCRTSPYRRQILVYR